MTGPAGYQDALAYLHAVLGKNVVQYLGSL